MTFIDAIIKINTRDDLELCSDDNELNGIHPSICVFKNGEFIGKLRWRNNDLPSSVDDSVLKELNA